MCMKSLWRSPFLTFVLILVDLVVLWQMWMGAYALRTAMNPHPDAQYALFSQFINPPASYVQALPYLLVCWLIVMARFGFYRHHERIASLNAPGAILWSVVWMVVACMVYNMLFKPSFGRAVIAFFAMGVTLYLLVSRTFFRVLKKWAVEHGHGRVRVLVVGGQDLGRETMLRIREHPDIGFRMVGFVKIRPEDSRDTIFDYPALGTLDHLIPIIQRYQVEEVFFADADLDEEAVFGLIEEVHAHCRVTCKVVANMLYVIINRAKVDEVTGLPVVAFHRRALSALQAGFKRGMDLVFGITLGFFLVFPSLLFALLIRLDSSGPVLFAHERVGRGGRLFKMYKFRTMYHHCDPYAEAPQNQEDSRVTRFGRFLRRTSLDEMPQLLNILRGDMSIVGPRPEMPFIVERYKPWQRARLQAKPGLTGLWQVAGRKNLPLHLNLEYDFYYVKNQSLALDGEVILRTIPAVFLGKGAY